MSRETVCPPIQGHMPQDRSPSTASAPQSPAPGRRFSLRAQFLGGFGIVLALTALVGLLGMRTASGISAKASASYEKSLKPLADLGAARASLNQSRALTLEHVLTEDKPQMRAIEAKLGSLSRDTTARLARVRRTLDDPREQAAFARLQGDLASARAANGKVLELSSAGQVREAAALTKSAVEPAAEKITADVATLYDLKARFAAAREHAITHAEAVGRTTAIIILLITIGTGLGIALWLSSRIRGSVKVIVDRLTMLRENCTTDLRAALEAVTRGDLTVTVTPVTLPLARQTNDEIGDVAEAVAAIRVNTIASVEAYNEMREQLAGMIGELAETVGTVSGASAEMASTSDEAGRAVGEIAAAVTDVAQGAERQVRMVESTREAVQEAARAATSSAQGAEATAEAAEQTLSVAREGVDAAEHATEAIRQVADASREIGTAIEGLSARSDQIGGIVDTITGIAEQTNLLALNAAIEAARAGDQGRGFAVVAEEVRKLAEESQAAAGQISALIGEIQADTGKVVGVVAEGERRTADGVATVERTREAFEHIGTAVEDMTGRVGDIAAAVQQISAEAQRAEQDISEVAAVAEESSASAEQVSASTQQTSASGQEIAASAQTLAGTAEHLSALVGRFTVSASA